MKIVILAMLAFFLVACSDSKEQIQEQNVAPETVKEVKSPVAQEKETPKKEVKAPEVQITVDETKQPEVAVQPVKEPIKEVEEKKVVEAQKTAVKPVASIDGSQLYVKCAACHGKNAEKSAMGKSQIIKGWSQDKVITALHGYKEGTYGGTMKGLMKSQIANFSEDELKALAAHISKL